MASWRAAQERRTGHVGANSSACLPLYFFVGWGSIPVLTTQRTLDWYQGQDPGHEKLLASTCPLMSNLALALGTSLGFSV